MMKVYGDRLSGNCYKVKLLLAQMGREHEWVDVDILKKETRTPEFLARNPVGKIPVLEIEEGVYLAESNAILNYLADGTRFLPAAHLARARVLQWQFFEQCSQEPSAAMEVMEKHLASRRYFVDERYTIADITLYAYTHVAHEGGFELARFPAIRAWLERVRNQPGYGGMEA